MSGKAESRLIPRKNPFYRDQRGIEEGILFPAYAVQSAEPMEARTPTYLRPDHTQSAAPPARHLPSLVQRRRFQSLQLIYKPVLSLRTRSN